MANFTSNASGQRPQKDSPFYILSHGQRLSTLFHSSFIISCHSVLRPCPSAPVTCVVMVSIWWFEKGAIIAQFQMRRQFLTIRIPHSQKRRACFTVLVSNLAEFEKRENGGSLSLLEQVGRPLRLEAIYY